MQNRYFSDEELVAFLDGEEEFAPVDEIRKALENDVALTKRVDALRIDTAKIAASFEALVPDQDRFPDLPSVPVAQGFSFANLASAAAVALAIGVGVGFWMQDQGRSGWTDYVAAYQALYSSGTIAHINNTPQEQQAELDRVAGAIGKTMSADALRVYPEAQYKRAQILNFEGRALVQLAFATENGEPLALCIIRSVDQKTRGVEASRMEGMSAASWSQGAYEYLLIGGQDDALVSRIAAGFASMDL